MEDGIKNSITQALKDRLSSPVWGYILLSWLGFNWQNIARLFMSSNDVEYRIFEITNQEWFYPHYFIAPVAVGCALAGGSPYLQLMLSWVHKKAEASHNKGVNSKLEQKYRDEIKLASLKAQASTADELELEVSKTKRIEQQEAQKKAVLDTKTLEAQFEVLTKQKEKLDEDLLAANAQIIRNNDEADIWRNKSLQVIHLLRVLSDAPGLEEMNDVRAKLKLLYSAEDLNVAGNVLDAQIAITDIIERTLEHVLWFINQKTSPSDGGTTPTLDSLTISQLATLKNDVISSLQAIVSINPDNAKPISENRRNTFGR